MNYYKTNFIHHACKLIIQLERENMTRERDREELHWKKENQLYDILLNLKNIPHSLVEITRGLEREMKT